AAERKMQGGDSTLSWRPTTTADSLSSVCLNFGHSAPHSNTKKHITLQFFTLLLMYAPESHGGPPKTHQFVCSNTRSNGLGLAVNAIAAKHIAVKGFGRRPIEGTPRTSELCRE